MIERQPRTEQKLKHSTSLIFNVRSIVEELHISLTPNKEHEKVFPNVPL